MTERLAIIDSYRSMWGERKRGEKVRIRFLIFWILLQLAIYILHTGRLAFSPVDADIDSLSVMLSLVFAFSWPKDIIELVLLRHKVKMAKKLQPLAENSRENSRLKEVIQRIQDPKGWNKIVFKIAALGLMIPIMLFAMVQFESPLSHWEYVKPPFLLFHGIILFLFVRNYWALKQNIRSVEAEC